MERDVPPLETVPKPCPRPSGVSNPASANIPCSHLQDLVEDFDDVVGEGLEEGAGDGSGIDMVHEFMEEPIAARSAFCTQRAKQLK